MTTDEIKTLDAVLGRVQHILEVISQSELLIYFLGMIVIFSFLYGFMRMILDFISKKRIDAALDKNSQMLGEVRTALTYLTREER